jgi:arginyl-tRNA--protein-N-Asp/Glu arginylyltransferase
MLGLYAFGCEKLRYKAEIQPSELMDPVPPLPSSIVAE